MGVYMTAGVSCAICEHYDAHAGVCAKYAAYIHHDVAYGAVDCPHFLISTRNSTNYQIINNSVFRISDDFPFFMKPRGVDCTILAERIMADFGGNIISFMDEIYVWNALLARWQTRGELLIAQRAQAYLQKLYKKHYIDEIIHYIRTRSYISYRQDIPEMPPTYIPFVNGYYNLETGEFRPHSPSAFFRCYVATPYDAQAPEPRNAMKFIEEIGGEYERLLWEILAYCLYRGYPFQKFFFLFGEGANGKSTFLNLLTAVLGHENVSSRSLTELARYQFALTILKNKLANIAADLPYEIMKNAAIVKALTGDDVITAEGKYRREPIIFRNYAKMIFSANRPPLVLDDSYAFWRRVVFIPFRNMFPENPRFFLTISTEEEKRGIIKKAVEILRELLVNGKFSYAPSVEEARDMYLRSSSPIRAFCDEVLRQQNDSFISTRMLYDTFVKYAHEKNLTIPTYEKFSRVFPVECGFSVQHARRRIGSEIVRGFIGVAIQTYEQESLREF